ncbi:hypothetical protein ABPG77_000795 [Micractinium sp. CCAP 211/92]
MSWWVLPLAWCPRAALPAGVLPLDEHAPVPILLFSTCRLTKRLTRNAHALRNRPSPEPTCVNRPLACAVPAMCRGLQGFRATPAGRSAETSKAMDELDIALFLDAEEQELAALSPFAASFNLQHHAVHAAPLNGDQVARLMQLQFIAQAAADALLAGQPLSQPQEDALLLLWPTLLRLTAALPGAASDATPFAASACTVVLAQRPDASAGGRAAHLILPTAAQLLSSDGQHAASCTFELAAPATAEETRELQAFAEQLSRSVEQRSKEVLEDTLSELSRQPSASIIDLLRSSIEGKQSGSSALQLAMSLRSRLHALTSGSSHLDSPASCSLHTSLTLSTE